MIAAIQSLLRKHCPGENELGATRESTLQAAAAALLMEVASADDHIGEDERRAIRRIVRETFHLTVEQAADISRAAERGSETVTSLYPFTRLLTSECSMEERIEIVYRLWEVAFADGHIDAHEEHLIRKIASLLYVPHSQFIRGKLTQTGEK
jgi:uncharacterized tellurite resistance protein B-like protein